ncbi:response regulator [Candidatus Albibeggiatoa sp. nov. NOAA]|uniref:response regulator n=1 Tax=Candidatus Albibeggiatoa sp. nov. NOAA TaxID=3162724 RepID=UPI0032FCCF2D|nr:response regulator [Thiotrichaceae bacterium]
MENQIKILYVDDNEMSDGMVERRLIRRGFNCVRAMDGQQAVDFAHRELPDLILMDMSLPVKTGWDATREIKEAEDTKHIPIIALTAHAMSVDREYALKAGCDDYQPKPVELPRLLEKIHKLLPSTN